MEVAGSAVGIASLGIEICQGLLSYYDGWKGYESDICGARDSIADLQHTLILLKENLENGGLDTDRTERVKSCLESCTGGLAELSRKLNELRKYDKPEGLRQKARSEVQKMWYPFRKETITKLRGNVADVRERLKLALQVLQLAVQQSDRWRNIVNWLSPTDPWTNHHSARQRHEPGTGAWLLESDSYMRWKAGKVKHLWISGKAGCGKTVLCSTMVEDVQQHCHTRDDLGLGVFYFSFSDQRKQSYEDLLRSLVVQLAWKEPGLSMLQQAYDRPNRSVPGEDELERVLLSSLTSHRQVFLMLDAVDESPEDAEVRQRVLEGVEELTQKISNVKILATSRPLRDVRESMEMLKADQISVASSSVDIDIRKYVVAQLSRDRRFSRLDAKTTGLIEETLSTQADGMFRWAYCQLQELKKLKSTKPNRVRDALRALPATLDDTYERMLCEIEKGDRGEALILLRWLTYAQSPPTLGQLAEATIVDPTVGEGKVDANNRGGLEDSLNILSGLVIVIGTEDDQCTYDSDNDNGDDDQDSTILHLKNIGFSDGVIGDSHRSQRITAGSRVRLAHFSVKEYLQSERIRNRDAREFYFENAKEHRFMAQSCLTYITYYCNDEGRVSTAEDLATYPLLGYAAESWYYHSLLQEHDEFSREVSFLDSETFRRTWLLVHQPDRSWRSPFQAIANAGSGLYYASYIGLGKVVEMLLDRGADVNAQGGEYGNALQAASWGGHEKVVEMLLDKGADVSAEGGEYGNALYAASVRGHEKVVEMLLDKGADVSAEGGEYGNALQAASCEGHEKVVEILLHKGADVNAQGGHYGNALHAASEGGHEKVVEMLLDKGADVNAEEGYYGNALYAASLEGHEKVVQTLLDKGANVNAGEGHYGTALYAASLEGREKVVEMLVDKGADVDAQGGQYGNALQAASHGGHEKVVEMLLGKGADVDAQGGYYDNALQAASWGGHEKVVEMLLHKGADVNAQGGQYGNALQAASILGHERVVEMLLDKGADVNAEEGYYGNALHAASVQGHRKVVEMLLDKGADVNAEVDYLGNALHAASVQGHGKVVEMLLAKGADVNAQGGLYGNALQAASWGCHKKVVEMLLAKGADVNAQGGLYGNALQAASLEGHEKVVTMLVDKGADVNAQGGRYGNALQAASEGGHEKVVQMLTTAEADTSA